MKRNIHMIIGFQVKTGFKISHCAFDFGLIDLVLASLGQFLSFGTKTGDFTPKLWDLVPQTTKWCHNAIMTSYINKTSVYKQGVVFQLPDFLSHSEQAVSGLLYYFDRQEFNRCFSYLPVLVHFNSFRHELIESLLISVSRYNRLLTKPPGRTQTQPIYILLFGKHQQCQHSRWDS